MSHCAISAAEAGGQNLLAFLDMLAWSEGTDNGRQPTKDRGYDVLVGGKLFTGYADHPRQLITVNSKGLKSTAAGRYQLLQRYYDAYRVMLRLLDFSPLSQDRIALQQIRERRAIPMIQQGHLDDAINACSNIWASLPGSGNTYGQHLQPLDKLHAAFIGAGGQIGG